MSEFEDLKFEERVKRDLRRVDAPEGFADRVMGRVAEERREERKEQSKGRLLVMPRRAAWMAIAAMLLVGIAIGGWQRRQQELREERQAAMYRQQLDAAMQVTGRTLVDVQERIGHAGEFHASGRKREVEQ